MKILVTGADGFVGKHLVRELELYGHKVETTDRAYDEGKPRFDLAQAEFTYRLVRQRDPDCVVHLAAKYGRLLCEEDPVGAINDNVTATVNVAAACADREIPVLYASSSEIYGEQGKHVVSERTKPGVTTTIYGLSKRWGEEAFELYFNDTGTPVTVVRMNMLYGPEQQPGVGRAAIANFVENALTRRKITVHRGATRSHLYITDAIRALRHLIELSPGGVWHLANDHEYDSLHAQAAHICHLAGVPSDRLIEVVEPPPNQILVKNFTAAKLEKKFDWKPQITFEEGIERQVAWTREALK